MAEAAVISGTERAARVTAKVAEEAAKLHKETGVQPGLAVVIVGDDPASRVYVASKGRKARECGLHAVEHALADTTSEDDLLALLDALNADPAIHGILVQLPLPKQIDAARVLERISPDKDVDGFHVVNVGRLTAGLDGAFVPCTPAGSMLLIADALGADLSGKHAVVVGRSNIVGKPMASLLLAANATVTVAHSRTRDIAALCRTADILVAAVGRPQMVKADWVKPGAVVIDVGINRLPPADGETKGRLVGDVDFDACKSTAGAITPVPGGVGPMTIAMLMANTLTAACRAAGRAPPAF